MFHSGQYPKITDIIVGSSLSLKQVEFVIKDDLKFKYKGNNSCLSSSVSYVLNYLFEAGMGRDSVACWFLLFK